jgi:lysozyme family protein
MPLFNETLRQEYDLLFDTCIIRPGKYKEVDACLEMLLSGRDQYESVGAKTGVPWYFTGIIHSLECSGNFKTHLHNGDPLTERTKKVPKDHPRNGTPPFTWVESAEDALRLKSLHKWTDWTVPGILYQLERYNGFGYRNKEILSPYLWSFSNHYTRGKYTSDGHYDPGAVSKQVGAAVLLRRMSEKQIAIAGESDLITRIRQTGVEVTYQPNAHQPVAAVLQTLLNRAGQHLRIDGFAGPMTSTAFRRIAGHYLKGDPRNS